MRELAVLGIVICAACGNDGTSLDDLPVDAGTVVLPDGAVVPAPDGGSPGTPDAPGAPDAMVALTICEEATRHSDLAWLQEHVFTPSCAGCHGGDEPEVHLSLEAGRTYANLVNKGASTVPGWIRVVPGSTATSYLVVSLGRADGPPPRDGFMPLNAEPLCVEKLEAIERWIAAGAAP